MSIMFRKILPEAAPVGEALRATLTRVANWVARLQTKKRLGIEGVAGGNANGGTRTRRWFLIDELVDSF